MNNRYDKQFKEEAVRLSDETGVKCAAQQLGLSYNTLVDWRGKRRVHGDTAFIGSGRTYRSTEGMTQKEMGLQRENDELRRANEILKDALGFFAKDRKKQRQVGCINISAFAGANGARRGYVRFWTSVNRDITEVPCSDGKLYVAPVLDCYNGEIVGLSMDDNMRAGLCVKAFENACRSQNAHSMIVHSDRGRQFTGAAFRASLARHGATQSMSGAGKCYDNARMESFFATLKKEKLYRINTRRLPMAQVKTIIFRRKN